jgi:hypothetical protein
MTKYFVAADLPPGVLHALCHTRAEATPGVGAPHYTVEATLPLIK